MCFNRRSILFILLISLSGACLPAAYTNTRSDSFTVQAGYGAVTDITVTEIPAQSSAYIAGMPFNIEEALVRYNSNPAAGRRIATFNMLSNQPFRVSIKGEPMRHINDNGGYDATPELDYILYFECDFGVYENGNIVARNTDTFTYSSQNAESSWQPDVNPDENSYIGNVDGYIYFMFNSATTTFIASSNDTTLPPGSYGADVTLEIVPLSEQGGEI